MLENLKRMVFNENLRLVRSGLVILTWGNVSGIDRDKNLVVIKPSGVSYSEMTENDMVVVDMDGKIVDGRLNPSSDTPTHLYLYKQFPKVGGVVHTHSLNATAFAQAGRSIISFGTTHADAFFGEVPCTRSLSQQEVENDYELNTGKVICETFKDKDYKAVPAVLVMNHGPFAWGDTPQKAVDNAITLEAVAEMALKTRQIEHDSKQAPRYLMEKHYYRKHGENAYYGQKKV